jgi:hypothetical protein
LQIVCLRTCYAGNKNSHDNSGQTNLSWSVHLKLLLTRTLTNRYVLDQNLWIERISFASAPYYYSFVVGAGESAINCSAFSIRISPVISPSDVREMYS